MAYQLVKETKLNQDYRGHAERCGSTDRKLITVNPAGLIVGRR